MATNSSSQQIRALKCLDALFEITWRDGHVSRYPTIWLLNACRCRLLPCGSERQTRPPRFPPAAVRASGDRGPGSRSSGRMPFAARNDPRRWMSFRKD